MDDKKLESDLLIALTHDAVGATIEGAEEARKEYKEKHSKTVKSVQNWAQKEYDAVEERVKKDPKKLVIELLEIKRRQDRALAYKDVQIRQLENEGNQMAEKLRLIKDILKTRDEFGSEFHYQKHDKTIDAMKNTGKEDEC